MHRTPCKALSHPLLVDLHNGIMWVQGCKDGYYHFIKEENQSPPEEEESCGCCPRSRDYEVPEWTFHLSSISLQLPASGQGQGCPSTWEEKSDLLMADTSQSSVVSPSRSIIREDGGQCIDVAPGPSHSTPASHRGGLPCPHPWSPV